MKKIYLSAIALSVASLSFGQGLTEKMAFGLGSEPTLNPKDQGNNNKALGQVIWTDDFNTPSDWTIDNNGQTAAGFGWTIDAVSDGWWSAAGMTSTSGGNYAELSNGDAINSTQALNVVYNLTLANPLNLVALGGSENVTLEFEQFGARFNDLTQIQISTDGTNFVTVGDNLDKAVHSQSASNVWGNPEIKRVNLSTFLTATTATSVWLRFTWTTNFPASASNPNVWVTYGWYLDDLKISTNPDNNITTSSAYYGSANLPYTRIPVDQIQPIDFVMKAKNEGGVNQTLTQLTADINSGAFTFTSATTTLLVGATDSLFTTASWTPPATVGVPYSIDLTVASDSTDDVPADNSFTFPNIEVSQYVYAMDDYSATPGNGGGFSGTDEEFEAGNFYDVVANATATSVDVQIGANAVAGNALDAAIYELDATGNFVLVVRSPLTQITAAEVGTLKNFIFSSPTALVAGKTYFAAIHSYAGAGEFFYGTSGNSPDNASVGGVTSLIYYGTMDNPVASKNFYTTQTPMVRLNFDPLTSVDNIAAKATSFTAYPNPSTGMFNINLTKDMGATVNMTVRNVVGQTVINKQVAVTGNQVETISLANYDKGIYFLTINNETVKLIVE